MNRTSGSRLETVRLPLQVALIGIALLSAGGAVYRYVSTRGTENPFRPQVPTLVATPASGTVGMRPFVEVTGWPRGTDVKVALCRPTPSQGCVDLGTTRSPGRVRAVAIPATLGAAPVQPGPYELRTIGTSPAQTVTEPFRIVEFRIGSPPAARPFANADPRRMRLGTPTTVAAGGPCASRFVRDNRLLLGRTLFDPRTAVTTDLSVAGAEVAWSPSGDRLAIVTDDRKEIRMARPDGAGQEVVVREARGLISSVTWSPDGEHVAFVARPQPGVPGGPPRPTVYALDLTTGDRTTVVPAEAVAWSPVADRLAIEVAQGAGRAIHVVDAGGKGAKVTDGRSPSWSPDGSLIALVRGGDAGSAVVVKPGAGEATLVEAGVCGAGFSADGGRMVVVTRAADGGTAVALRPIRVQQ